MQVVQLKHGCVCDWTRVGVRGQLHVSHLISLFSSPLLSVFSSSSSSSSSNVAFCSWEVSGFPLTLSVFLDVRCPAGVRVTLWGHLFCGAGSCGLVHA